MRNTDTIDRVFSRTRGDTASTNDDFSSEEITVVEPTLTDAELLEQLRRGVTRPIRVRANITTGAVAVG